MIRKATTEDRAAIAAFLEGRIESSMFLLGNLEAFGTENTTHPHGTAFFLRETGEGINGVFGVTNGGFLLCQLPGLTATEAQTYAHLLKGYTLRGMTGDDQQVQTVLNALNVPADAWAINKAEALYRLDLANLDAPGDVTLRKPEEQDVPLLTGWYETYMRETGTGIDGDAANRARAAVGSEKTRLLVEDGGPTAMTGINSAAGPAVQVGGVFVPPALRGQGRAGRAVAAHLAELRDTGREVAILFAASEEAAKAYERIGFEKVGAYRVALLKDPFMLSDPT